MIELDSLKFTVDTAELVNAVTKVQDLQKAVTQLNKPLVENAKISAKVAAENAKVAVAEEKVAQAKAKTAEAENKANAAKARAEKATDNLIKKTKEQTSVLERQKVIYDFMTAGYSKGQATVLAQAKAQGALADEIAKVGKVLADQRKLIGGDPFDKSVSGLTSLRNAMVELRDEQRTFTAGVQMTSKQYKEFARDKLRIIEVSKAEGVALSELKQRLRDHGAEYVRLTNEVNRLTEAEKARERAQRDQLNASRSIAAEDEKIASILRSVNSAQTDHISLSDRAARSIANYERNLRIAGISGEQAAIKLEKYKQGVLAVQKAEQQRQVDMLSRALAPQISDVAVSLASGMNPLTVALQQGLQIRDLIGLSGVAVQDLQVAFRSAAADMVSSLRGTAAALGSLFIGALISAGDSVVNFGTRITGTDTLLGKMRNTLVGITGENSRAIKVFDVLGSTIRAGVGINIALAATGLISYLVAIKQVITEQNALTRSLALTGASLGLTKDQAVALSQSLDGVSESKAIAVLTEMAKVGGFTKTQFEAVTKAAVDLQKYANISFEDTVKNFAKLQGKPTEALAEFAKQNGFIEIAVLKQVKALEDQGKMVEAVDLAVKAYSESQQQAAALIQSELHPITQIWIDIKSAIGQAWEGMKEFARSDAIVTPLRVAFEVVRNVVYDVWAGIKLIGGAIGAIIAVAEQLVTGGGITGAAAVVRAAKEDFRAGLSAREQFMNPAATTAPSTTNNREQNSKNATEFLRTLKKTREEAEKEANRLEKLGQKYLKDFTYNAIDADAVVGDLTKSQEELIRVLTSPDWSKLPNQAQILAKAYEAIGKEQVNVAIKERVRLAKEEFEEFSKYLDAQEEFMSMQEETRRSLEESSQLLSFEASLAGILPEERARLLQIKQVELKLAKELLEIDRLFLKDSSEWITRRAMAMDNAQKEIQNINKKVSMDLNDKLITDVSSAIETALFEGGKAGSQKLRDIIEAELRKPVTVFIRAVISDIFGGSGVGGSNSANALTKLSDTFSNFSKIGSNLGSSLGSLGSWLEYGTNPFSQQGSMLAAQEAGMGTMSGSLSQFGSMAGNALAGVGLFKGVSNGYSISKGADIIGTLASAYFGPIGGAIGGLVNRAFGRKLKDTGIQGTFSGADQFTGNTFQFYKGGWFRSDKTELGALDPMLASGLGQAYGGLTSANMAMANLLGIDASGKLSGFKSDIKFSTQGLNEQQIQQKLQEVLGDVAEKQAKKLLEGSEEFIRFGETAVEALGRMSSSLQSVNKFLDLTNGKLFDLSTQGGDTASSLVDLFGGVQNFDQITGQYYQNFFTEQERLTKGQELLANAFKDLGLQVPATVTAYRQLIESQDLTTESGRQTFTSLMTLSAAFYELDTASREATSTMIEEINRLRGVVQTTSTGGFEGTRASFLSAIAAAGAGDATAMASLPGLSQSLESMFAGNARSLEDVNRFRSWLANSIGSVVPAFADGGIHAGGMRLVGENGPELEVTGPSRIFSAGETAGMLGGNNVVQAIAVLNQNLELLRAEVRADVQHNAKTAKLLDRVIPEGDSIKVSNL